MRRKCPWRGCHKFARASTVALLGAFLPCHPEQSRNPSEARIKRCGASFGISAKKFDSATALRFCSVQNDTGGATAGAKGVITAKFNKNVVPYRTFTTSVFDKGQQSFARFYVHFIENVLSLLYHTGIPWMMHIIAMFEIRSIGFDQYNS
jgi:hypothetical protein